MYFFVLWKFSRRPLAISSPFPMIVRHPHPHPHPHPPSHGVSMFLWRCFLKKKKKKKKKNSPPKTKFKKEKKEPNLYTTTKSPMHLSILFSFLNIYIIYTFHFTLDFQILMILYIIKQSCYLTPQSNKPIVYTRPVFFTLSYIL